MNAIYPRFTNILGIANVDDGYVILENPYKLSIGVSNLYKVDYLFNAIWDADLSRPDDPYVGKFAFPRSGILKIFSTDGVVCEIELHLQQVNIIAEAMATSSVLNSNIGTFTFTFLMEEYCSMHSH